MKLYINWESGLIFACSAFNVSKITGTASLILMSNLNTDGLWKNNGLTIT